MSSVEEMLERKRKRREQILKEEAAAREEDPVVRRERLFRERCVQCGIEVDKPDLGTRRGQSVSPSLTSVGSKVRSWCSS